MHVLKRIYNLKDYVESYKNNLQNVFKYTGCNHDYKFVSWSISFIIHRFVSEDCQLYGAFDDVILRHFAIVMYVRNNAAK